MSLYPRLPLRLVAPKKIYGINVYYKKDGDTQYQNYAYGLFDNIEDMTISLIGGYKYKFECSMVKNDADTLYHDDSMYYAPFHQGKLNYDIYKGTILENKFKHNTIINKVVPINLNVFIFKLF